jgi:hypothetical protein
LKTLETKRRERANIRGSLVFKQGVTGPIPVTFTNFFPDRKALS